MGRRGPQPRPDDEKRSAPLSLRLHPTLRAKLQEAADQGGVSLSSEISRRLEDSLTYGKRVADAFGSERNFVLMQMAAAPLKKSVDWLDDPAKFDRCLQSIIDLLELARPVGPRDSRARALRLLSPELGDGLLADAMWAIIRDADPTKPRHQRTEVEHFAVNAKRILGDIADRADPLFRSREAARTKLEAAYPKEEFSNMPDDELFEREEALIAAENDRVEGLLKEPPPYDPNWRPDENG